VIRSTATCNLLTRYHVVLIGFIMDSISNDFSHLSVGDLHASSEPSTPPALNRISLERDTFTDDDHKLLDEKIENSFSAFRKLNEEPDLPDLLSRVTMDNVRLTMLTPNQAEELLGREPSIAGLLRNGWQAGSFKEVRQLGVFPICSTSTFLLNINQRSCGHRSIVFPVGDCLAHCQTWS
jgi:hypothetical protein